MTAETKAQHALETSNNVHHQMDDIIPGRSPSTEKEHFECDPKDH